MGGRQITELVAAVPVSEGISTAPKLGLDLADIRDFSRLRHCQVRDVEALEIEYRTSSPVYLRFRNAPGLHVHLRRSGTGRYSIDNAGLIQGATTEMQVYCSNTTWFKNVFETNDVAPRNMLFGVPHDVARALLGQTAEEIFGYAKEQTYHARVRMRPELIGLVDDLFETPHSGIAGLRREARLLDILAGSLSSLQGALDAGGGTGYRLRPADVARLRAVEQHVAANLAADLSAEQLARLAGMSSSRFKAVFRDLYGQPIATYVRSVRMEAAAALLRTGLSVAEVSYRVGFKHPGHFARVFRDVHAVSPHSFASQGSAPKIDPKLTDIDLSSP